MKVVFITGITGQDGSYLTELLLEKNYIVHGLIRRASNINTSRIEHIFKNKNLKLHYGDMTDGASLYKILNDIKNSYENLDRLEVYNLAAQSHVKISFEMPEYTADTDAFGTLKLLEAIVNNNLLSITRFYQASTSELYGKLVETPQSETTPFYPRSPYGVAKLYGYWIVKNYREAYNMYACNGILFNHETVAGNSPMIFKTSSEMNAEIDIKPISEIVKYHTKQNEITIDETKPIYQETELNVDLHVWDNSAWTKVKFASGYKHDIVSNPKNPKIIISKHACYMATNTHNVIMEDNSEKEIQNIELNDKVKLIELPTNYNTNTIENFEAEFIGMIVGDGHIGENSNRIRFINSDESLRQYNMDLFKKICEKYNKEYKSHYYPSKSAFNPEKIDDYIDYIDATWFLKHSDIYDEDKTKRIPKYILNASTESKMAFLIGYNKLNNSIYTFENFETNSQVLACGLIYLLKNTTNQDYNINVKKRIDIKEGKEITSLYYSINELTNIKNIDNNVVKKIIEHYSYDGWFYDLETESGTFFCGVGQGLVHNSPRRGHNFVTRKITIGLGKILRGETDKLIMGNIDSLRDWGHAKDYVEGMWLMLQEDKPDDFVLATGEMHSVREFIEKAFKLKGFDIKWKGEGVNEIGYDVNTNRELIFISEKYFRPTEVDLLLGNPSKANNSLNWKPKVSFNELVFEMVQQDCN